MANYRRIMSLKSHMVHFGMRLHPQVGFYDSRRNYRRWVYVPQTYVDYALQEVYFNPANGCVSRIVRF